MKVTMNWPADEENRSEVTGDGEIGPTVRLARLSYTTG
jgi:hypothetical protein